MKKLMSAILAAAMLFTVVPAFAEDAPISVTVDGELMEFETEPEIINGSMYVPMRAIFEKLGATVEWDGETQTVTAKKKFNYVGNIDGYTEISANVTIGNYYMLTGKTTCENDMTLEYSESVNLWDAAFIRDGCTYVPLRAVSNALGCVVIWEEETNAVIVTKSLEYCDDTNILIELGIISEDDLNGGEYITNRESFEALANIYSPTTDLAGWDKTEELAALGDVDDELKSAILALTPWYVKYEEAAAIDYDANITNYEALVYLTRLIGDTYDCTSLVAEYYFTERSQTYDAAVKKGIITDTDMSAADDAITRADFYRLLNKSLFVRYESGSAGGVATYRIIDNLARLKAAEEAV